MTRTPQELLEALKNAKLPYALPTPGYRLWVNEERTVLFRLWPDGKAEVALRDEPGHIWGPPIHLTEDA